MKNSKLIFDITRTHLLTRIKQSGIAALGVTFGIGTFITLMSFMTGLNGLLDGLILNRTPHIHIYNQIAPSASQAIENDAHFKNHFNVVESVKPKTSLVRIHDALPLIDMLKEDERVLGVTPQVAAKAFYVAGSVELNGMVTGIDVIEESRLFNFSDYIIEGESENLFRNDEGILIGAGIAKKLSLQLGSRIQLSTASGAIFPLKVVGIYQSGLAEIDDIQSFVNIKMAQQLMGKGSNYITDINVKLHDIEQAAPMSKFIAKNYKLAAVDIKSANAQFETGTTIRNLITYSVSITLLIVAGFGIYNILNMLIYEKMNDIAILKATGFSGNDVQNIFIAQAVIIGIIGGILGLVLGYFISVAISNTPFETDALPTISTYPVNFNPMFYIVGISFAIVATFFAGFLPSLRAKKMDPVEIIRKQ